MIPEAHSVQPPTVAVRLTALFARPEDEESVLGDLSEEFCQVVSRSGAAAARDWYWRQAVKTSACFGFAAFRAAPWLTAAAIVGGWWLTSFVFGLEHQALLAAFDRWGFYERHPDAYMFWLTNGQLMGMVVLAMLVGCIVALAARGRELVATMTLGFIKVPLAIVSCVLALGEGDYGFLWTLPWTLSFSLATVVGGAWVRMRRSNAARRPSAT